MKAYCINCKQFKGDEHKEDCTSPFNKPIEQTVTGTYKTPPYSYDIYKSPREINQNNDCEWYEPKK